MNHLPFTIRQQREQLMSLWNANTVYGAMVKFRDLTEVLLRLPVLCAGAFILAKGGSEREQLTAELVRRGDLDGWDWIRAARKMQGNQHIPNMLLRIIDRICQWTTSEKVIEWRNTEIAHGALRFNPDRDFLEDFQKKMLSLDRLLEDLQEDFSSILISEDASTVRYEDETLPIVPYTYSESGDAYLFSDYKKGLATGLCYALGIRRAMPSEHFVQVAKSMADRLQPTGVSDELLHTEISDLLDELNEATNFEYPNYLRDWLSESMNEATKGTLLLEMERGMGKSAFARALDGKSTDSAYDSFKLDDTFTRAYYCSRISIRSKGDFLSGIRNSLLTSEENSLLYSSNEMIPDLSKDSTPEDFAALLNWCKEQIVENHLLLIIDGIDEIPAEYCSILQMLPSADLLDNGIYILLTCRTKDSVCTDTTSKEENSHIETVRSLVHPDRHCAYARNDTHNLETLKSYFNTKIIPKDSKLRKNNRSIEDDIQKLIDHPGQMRFLEVRIIGTLLKSGKISDISSFVDHPDLFEYYLDYLRREEYGDIVFQRLTELLAALAIAQEELTLSEIAYILGEDDVSVQLLTFVRDLSGILRLSRDYRGNHVSLASEAYRSRIISDYPETVERHRQSLVDILTYVDIDALKAQAPDKHNPIPDGLLYIAAYLPALKVHISKEVMERVYHEIDDGILNSMELHILNRRAVMGEKWSNLCGKQGWYESKPGFINSVGVSNFKMSEYGKALEWDNKHINLCKEYLTEGIIKDEDRLAKAYINRGNTYAQTSKYDEALRDYREGIRIMEALKAKDKLYDPNDLATAYLNRGGTYWSTSRYVEALRDYGECIRIREELQTKGRLYDPNDLASAYLNRGIAYSQTSKHEEAMRDYVECIRIMKDLSANGSLYDTNDLAKAYLNRGVTYRETGKYDEALRDYGACIRIREDLQVKGRLYDLNDLARVYMNRSVAYDDMGKYDKALRDYGACIRIREDLHKQGRLYDPNGLAKAYMNRGVMLDKIGKYDDALRDYGECIRIRKDLQVRGRLYDLNDLAKTYMNRGVSYRSTGKYKEALRDYGECIRIMEDLQAEGRLYDPNDLASACLNRGVTFDTIGKHDEAMRDYWESIRIMEDLQANGKLYDSNNLAKAYMNRGVTYKANGKYDEALRDYGACIGIRENLQKQGRLYDPNDLAKAYSNRGAALQSTGRYDEALRDYGACISIREDLRAKNSLYDWQYYLGSAWLKKAILLVIGFQDKEGALEIINHAIYLLEKEDELSYQADNTLLKLHTAHRLLTESDLD